MDTITGGGVGRTPLTTWAQTPRLHGDVTPTAVVASHDHSVTWQPATCKIHGKRMPRTH